jgi:hypothetical protein
MVSKVSEIIAITKEADLIKEMTAFENAIDKRLKSVEDLLDMDVNSSNEFAIEKHMSVVESYRQIAVRVHSLAACFLEHSKSPWFTLSKSKDISEFDRHAKQKQMVAPFFGLEARSEGLIKSIDSRVNMCKVLLKLTDDRLAGTK